MKKNVARRSNSAVAKKNVKPTTLRLESLESRELLSVAPVSEPFAPAVYSAPAVYESGAATIAEDIVDLSAALRATSIVVTSEADVVDPNDGVLTLREALAGAGSGATITFDGSLQGKTIALNSSLGQLTIDQSVTIDASNLWDETNSEPGLTISGQGKSTILYIYGEYDVEVNGITLANGYSQTGGAIYCCRGTLSLDNCVIRDNKARMSGGGVASVDSETTLTNCSLTNNIVFDEQTSQTGGAIYSSGTLTLNNCVISDNQAGVGGGAYSTYESVTTLVNCLVVGNSASSDGGGLELYGSSTLYNCTIANNTSDGNSGGVLFGGGNSSGKVFNTYNTIIVGNSARYSDADVRIGGGVANASNTLSSFSGWSGGANNLLYSSSQPLFTNANSGDYTLASNSQALDKGNNQYVASNVDLAGNIRVSGGTVDLGAYEKIRETPSTIVTTADDVVDYYDGEISLREALGYAGSGDTISFDGSLQGGTIELDSTLGQLTVNQSVTIDASGLWNTTVSAPELTISGRGTTRILALESGVDVSIIGIALTNGAASTESGGAIYGAGATLSLSNCEIRDNKASSGGGIYSYGGATTLVNCAVTNNTATSDSGGAIYVFDATLSLENCLISGNEARFGGGAFSLNGETTLKNCTVTNNAASNCGGGVFLDGTVGSLAAYNSIIVGNSASSGEDVDFSSLDLAANASASATLSSYEGWASGEKNLTYNASKPLFNDADSGDYSLAVNAQVLDKGDNQYVTTFYDLAGNLRISDSKVDLGAYEFQKIKIPTPEARVGDKTTSSITVEWDPVPYASGYRLIWKNRTDPAFSVVTVDASATSYEFTELVEGGIYYCKVQALGDKIEFINSDYTQLLIVKSQQTLPTPVPSVAAKTETSIVASWGAVPNANGYNFLWKNETDADFTVVALDASTTSYQLADLDHDATYNWKVQAVGDNAEYLDSAYTDVQEDMPRQTLVAPVPFVSEKTETSITVEWDNVSGAIGYRLIWKNRTASSYEVVSLDSSTTSYELANLDSNGIYYWKVQALGDWISYLNSPYTELQVGKPLQASAASTSAVLDLGDELFDELDEEDYDLLAVNFGA